ncbi:DNA-binding protein H-NS [Paraburkholderia tropica]|uniref:H-NS family nucleoid-associated regulatory protein n=1 Tax=Paraburkholderia tropica TaxID=92647 RepID=UPI00160937C9|nr:H-NS family nucleoid-associated regulatory protein [Paraburkholderia tropica]MBB2984323.1 DNA-binding protein H-NS [Paraburkholderia tropica]MBB3004025.1 DNA-binding protein H-NS [Paraburkholderia tropica]MBB6323182.1 DNA-binding protein H-NS [Paraburkholderia tropica]
MATLDSIQAKIAKLQAQAEAIVVSKSTVVLNKIRDLMDKHGISVADVDAHVGKRRGRKTASAVGTASVAKYRDPKSGATWTGHGRAPQWIASAKDRSKFLVEGASQAPAPVKAEAKRAGNYKRGPQPALYRDPKSGATWSGRGRAPAWIANAKDRTRFLIAKADNKAVKAPAAKKTATAKKSATAKKATPAKQANAVKNVAPAKKAAAVKRTAGKRAATAKKAEAVKAANTQKEAAAAKKATVTKKAVPAKKATTARKAPAKKATAAKAQLQDKAIASAPTENAVPATELPLANAAA